MLIQLYYMKSCGHSIICIPVWEKLKRTYENNMDFVFEEYEPDNNLQKIKDELIIGYPTIRIAVDGVKKDYDGEMSVDAIIKYINEM